MTNSQKKSMLGLTLLAAAFSLVIFAGDTVSLRVTRTKSSEHGKWDPVGEDPAERHINVSADGAEVKLIPKTVKTITNIGCADIRTDPDSSAACNTTCTIEGADTHHKLHRRGKYTIKGEGTGGDGDGGELVWNASGRTTDYDVRLEYMGDEPIKTAHFDTLTKARLIIEGDLQGNKIKLVGDGVKTTDPDREYTASAEFTFTPTRISAARDDLSISAVEVGNEGNVWDKLTLMSYLFYKPVAQPCLKQRKDTNAVCEKCPEPADLVNHASDKPHPDDYNEIPKCKHCNKNCTRAVVVTMGKKNSQDEVFHPACNTLTKNHGVGIFPYELDYLTIIQGTKQELAQKVYTELKTAKKLYGGKPGHSVLIWGIAMNTWEGTIHEKPQFKYSDPADPAPLKDDEFDAAINAVYK